MMALVLLTFGSIAFAQNKLENPGFESILMNWSFTGGGISEGRVVNETDDIPVPEGNKYFKITLNHGDSNAFTSQLQQDIKGLYPGKLYQLSFDVLSSGFNYYDTLALKIINPTKTADESILEIEKHGFLSGTWRNINTCFIPETNDDDLSDAYLSVGFANDQQNRSEVRFYLDNFNLKEQSKASLDLHKLLRNYDHESHFNGEMQYASDDANAYLAYTTYSSLYLHSDGGSSVARGAQLEGKLLPGLKYTFRVTYKGGYLNQETNGPDKLLVGSNVVWERPPGFSLDKSLTTDYFEFDYVPEASEQPWIWFYFSNKNKLLYTIKSTHLSISCQSVAATTNNVEYEQQALPSYQWQHAILPRMEDVDAPRYGFKCDPITEKNGNDSSKPVIATKMGYNYDPDSYNYLVERGITGINYENDDQFTSFSTPSASFTSLLENYSGSGKLKTILVKNNTLDRNQYNQPYQTALAYYLTHHASASDLYYWNPEIPQMINYDKTYADPDNHDYPDPRLFEYLEGERVKELTDFREKTLLGSWGPSSMKVIYNTDKSVFPLSTFFRTGIDVFMNKTIKRQNIQLCMANARGHAWAYDKKMFMRLDAWVFGQEAAWWMDEMKLAYRDFYYGGADYIDHESGYAISRIDDVIYPNSKGLALFDFAKFSAMHQGRGELNTPFGVMMGRGHIMGTILMNGGGMSGNDISETRMRYNRDMGYLDIFFADYWKGIGHIKEPGTGTDVQRLFTGTPYGTTDLIPYDITTEKAGKYKMIMMVGLNAMTADQATNLRHYVENGGVLLLSLGQALGEEVYGDRKAGAAAITLFEGLNIGISENLTPNQKLKTNSYIHYTIQAAEGNVLATWADDSPKIVEYIVGKGKIVLAATEALNHAETDGSTDLRQVIKRLAKENASITTNPFSSWLETFIMNYEDQMWSVVVFNHGHLQGVPEIIKGNKDGVWSGEISIDAAKTGISTRGLNIYALYPLPERGKVLPYEISDGFIHLDASVDQHAEFMLTQKEWTEIEAMFNDTLKDTSNETPDFKESNAWRLYPNPVSNNGQLTVKSHRSIENGTITIFKLNGTVISQQNVSGTDFKVQSKHLHKGIYIVELQSLNGPCEKSMLVVQ